MNPFGAVIPSPAVITSRPDFNPKSHFRPFRPLWLDLCARQKAKLKTNQNLLLLFYPQIEGIIDMTNKLAFVTSLLVSCNIFPFRFTNLCRSVIQASFYCFFLFRPSIFLYSYGDHKRYKWGCLSLQASSDVTIFVLFCRLFSFRKKYFFSIERLQWPFSCLVLTTPMSDTQ